MMRRQLSAIIAGLCLSVAAHAHEASGTLPMLATVTDNTKPAVDGVNGKFEVYGGAGQSNSVSISGINGLSPTSNSNAVWKGDAGAIGSVSIPLGHAFGAQIDIGSGAFGNSPQGEASGHLFWRDPDKGLVGIYGAGLILGSQVSSKVWTTAGEFETYLGKFTGRAIIGVQGESFSTGGLGYYQLLAYGGPSAFTQPNYFHDIVTATFYPIDDLALTVGHIYSFGRNAAMGEVEYLLPQFRGGNIAPSAFVRAEYGWNNSSNVLAGIKVYFGNHDKSLIRRQREDDPVGDLSVIEGEFAGPHRVGISWDEDMPGGITIASPRKKLWP